jgi:hypothetical protein
MASEDLNQEVAMGSDNPQTQVVEWIGSSPHRMWSGLDGIWHFEDETSYCDALESESETLLPLDVSSHLRPE